MNPLIWCHYILQLHYPSTHFLHVLETWYKRSKDIRMLIEFYFSKNFGTRLVWFSGWPVCYVLMCSLHWVPGVTTSGTGCRLWGEEGFSSGFFLRLEPRLFSGVQSVGDGVGGLNKKYRCGSQISIFSCVGPNLGPGRCLSDTLGPIPWGGRRRLLSLPQVEVLDNTSSLLLQIDT